MVNWIGRQLRTLNRAHKSIDVAADATGPVFEPLEERRLLSGDVTAVLNGTTLVIKGDADSNQITISGAGGNVTIDARAADPTATTINGAGGPAMFAGVTNILYQDKKGDDYVETDTLSITGNLTIRTNKGFNNVDIVDTTVGGKTSIRTGADSDSVYFAGTSVFTGKIDINTGGAADAVQFHTGTDGDGTTTASAQTKVKLGKGNDTFFHFEETGASFTDLMVNGATQVDIDGLNATGKLDIKGGTGDNAVTIDDVTIGGRTTIKTKSGDDSVAITTMNASDRVRISTGSGDDTITIDGLVMLSLLSVKLGAKADTDSVTVSAGTDQATSILAGRIVGDELDTANITDFTFLTTVAIKGLLVV